jgi:hypothetical protein
MAPTPESRQSTRQQDSRADTEKALKKMGTNKGGSATKNSIKGIDAVVTGLAAPTLTGSMKDRLSTMTSRILTNQAAAIDTPDTLEERSQLQAHQGVIYSSTNERIEAITDLSVADALVSQLRETMRLVCDKPACGGPEGYSEGGR